MLVEFADVVLHLDSHLAEIVATYGKWTYLILFLVIFCETGLVVTPFLPGDSLLFVIGSLAASGAFSAELISIVLIIAAVSGNTLNYFIGKYIGHKASSGKNSRFFKEEHLRKTQAFYERYGAMTIIISRFLPIIRTFAPFVAGMGKMNYWKFMGYNMLGGIAWVTALIYGGYLFGNIPIIKDNFSLVVAIIFLVSLLPALMGCLNYLKQRRSKSCPKKSAKSVYSTER